MSTWEQNLLALAQEGFQPRAAAAPPEAKNQLLNRAYANTAALTRQHSRTFFMASGLLPRAKRQAIQALYAFCRVCDDLVDTGPPDDRLARLEEWRRRALTEEPHSEDPIALAWTDTRIRYRIPLHYAHQLIDGVARDLKVQRYTNFEELAEYAYGVASTVGLMSMYIVGFVSEQALPYAVKLGVALQLTNILRDVGEDWRNGRLYLPQEELAAYNLNETDIATGQLDKRWKDFLSFQIDRTRRLYQEALPGLRFLSTDGRFAVAAAAELYQAILEDIESHDGDVFNRRAHLGFLEKLQRLPGIARRVIQIK